MGKTKNTSGQVADALQALIDATGLQAADYESESAARAAGFFTGTDFAERAGLSDTTARQRLTAAVKAGKVERVKVKLRFGLGNFYRVKR